MRYLGNKTKILNEIDNLLIDKNIKHEGNIFFDAFSGTASVSHYFKDIFKIVACDNLYFPYVIAEAKLNSTNGQFVKLGFNPFDYLNENCNTQYVGFIRSNYSPELGKRKYFTDENASIIDWIRDKIDEWHINGLIVESEKYFLIASLLEAVSKVANVAGVYGSYLKNWDPRAHKRLTIEPIDVSPYVNRLAKVYNSNITDIISNEKGDILYLDPPYTNNQYSTQYHILETIAKNDKPTIKGKTGCRDMSKTMSNFSKRGEAHSTFERLISNADFRYIILSYSTDGILSPDFIEAVFKRYGKPETYELRQIKYKRYKNSKAEDNKDHKEFLFYIEKKEKSLVKYSSPLNYIGGKHDLIDFITNYTPRNVNTYYDLFGGGMNVSMNVKANKIVYNDINFKVKELLESLVNSDPAELLKYFSNTIKKYGLSKNNKDAFMKLRSKYNNAKPSSRDFRDLYLLIMYGFQQQIRFNSSYEFNNPVGQACFNDLILEKLVSFINEAKDKNISLYADDYTHFEKYITPNDFVYCDPPYLITLGSYNDGKRGFNGWDSNEETRLLEFLERLNSKGTRFMLSNVLEHNGKVNTLLDFWIKRNNFKIITFQGKARGNRKEILILNY